jgi:hypothetical protein
MTTRGKLRGIKPKEIKRMILESFQTNINVIDWVNIESVPFSDLPASGRS